MKERLKSIARGGISIMAISLGALVVTHVVTQLHDIRLVVAALGGAFGYQPLADLCRKIKGLE